MSGELTYRHHEVSSIDFLSQKRHIPDSSKVRLVLIETMPAKTQQTTIDIDSVLRTRPPEGQVDGRPATIQRDLNTKKQKRERDCRNRLKKMPSCKKHAEGGNLRGAPEDKEYLKVIAGQKAVPPFEAP